MRILSRNPIASIILYSHGSSGLCCPWFQNSAGIQKCVVPICRSSGGRLAFILVPGIPLEFRHVLYSCQSSGGHLAFILVPGIPTCVVPLPEFRWMFIMVPGILTCVVPMPEFRWTSGIHHGSRNSTGIPKCVLPLPELRWTSSIHHDSRNSSGIPKCVLPLPEFQWTSGIHPGSRNSTGILTCVVPMLEFQWTSIIVPGIPPEFRHVLYPCWSSSGRPSWFQEFHRNSDMCCTHARVPVDVQHSSS